MQTGRNRAKKQSIPPTLTREQGGINKKTTNSARFNAQTGRNEIVPIMVTTYGMKTNSYTGGIYQQVTMEDLFKQ